MANTFSPGSAACHSCGRYRHHCAAIICSNKGTTPSPDRPNVMPVLSLSLSGWLWIGSPFLSIRKHLCQLLYLRF